MTTQTEALKLALEALEALIKRQAIYSFMETERRIALSACVGLRKALAEQPEQEPVAFEMDWPDYHAEAMGCGLEDRNITDRYEAMQYGWDEAIERIAERLPEVIHATPPQRKPLTRAVVWKLWCDAKFESAGFFWLVFARAIEAAHGIKE